MFYGVSCDTSHTFWMFIMDVITDEGKDFWLSFLLAHSCFAR